MLMQRNIVWGKSERSKKLRGADVPESLASRALVSCEENIGDTTRRAVR
jgi:hypothetical protein